MSSRFEISSLHSILALAHTGEHIISFSHPVPVNSTTWHQVTLPETWQHLFLSPSPLPPPVQWIFQTLPKYLFFLYHLHLSLVLGIFHQHYSNSLLKGLSPPATPLHSTAAHSPWPSIWLKDTSPSALCLLQPTRLCPKLAL